MTPYYEQENPITTGISWYNRGPQTSAPGDASTSRGLAQEGLVPMPDHSIPTTPEETREDRRRRQAREAAARRRARLRGLPAPLRQPGPAKGYKQSPEHVAKRQRCGERHHRWKGDDIEERSGRTRAERAFPVLGECADCGAPALDRHHHDENTANNDPSNIVPLCRSCHVRRHATAEGRYRDAMFANLHKAVMARHQNRMDTTDRSGDPCPSCDGRLGVICTRRYGEYRYTYIGCRKSRGGCGYSAGSYRDHAE